MSAYTGYPSSPSNSVDGYTITLTGSPPLLTATNATDGAVILGQQLTAPSDLTASQSGINVVLTWVLGEGEGYGTNVFRRSPTGNWGLIAQAGELDVSYTDVAPGEGEWLYRVQTFDGSSAATSAYSNTVDITVVVIGTPTLTITPTSGTVPTMLHFVIGTVVGPASYVLRRDSSPDFLDPDVVPLDSTDFSLEFLNPVDAYFDCYGVDGGGTRISPFSTATHVVLTA